MSSMLGCEVISALMKSPRTAAEVCEYVYGALPASSGHSAHVRGWINAFHDAGIVRIAGRKRSRDQWARVWSMQTAPFELPDTPLKEIN